MQFFPHPCKNFAPIASSLTCLTKKECPWKKGPLPDEAMKAFRELQSSLVSEPVMKLSKTRQALCSHQDAALGNGEKTY
jgi:hypothetical protein